MGSGKSLIEKNVSTSRRCTMVDITSGVASAIREIGLTSGIAVVYSPHTTGGITINEGFDPDVCGDLLGHLEDLVPRKSGFKHAEGNSDSHIKTSFVGSSQVVIVEGGAPLLGRWQRVFFCEFDGPRSRRYLVKGVPTS